VVQDVLVAQVVQHEEHREREDREAPEPEREPAARARVKTFLKAFLAKGRSVEATRRERDAR
jgi:hypothetical protein